MSYLENLPSYNKDSFSLYEPYNPENRKPVKTLTLCPKQKPEQVMRKDRSCILLRYLYNNKDKVTNKRKGESSNQVKNKLLKKTQYLTSQSSSMMTSQSSSIMTSSGESSSSQSTSQE